MNNEPGPYKIVDWLLAGDVSIAYQTRRDLLEEDTAKLKKLQARIALEGWGKQFLSYRGGNGFWGRGYYLPKWTSTHYTLLDIKNLCFPKGNKEVDESVNLVLNAKRGVNGGINYSVSKHGDVCVSGMVLNFASYFIEEHPALNEITDFILNTRMDDGGWNCRYWKGDTHSSLHTTLSVLEGLLEFRKAGNTYREKEIREAEKEGIEFLLQHRLYRSHRTGAIIDPKMLKLTYPSRWRYDILRALDYMQNAKVPYDARMKDALTIVRKKQREDGSWPLQSKHAGQFHFEMEKAGQPSRWNTLRVLRIFKHFARDYDIHQTAERQNAFMKRRAAFYFALLWKL